MATKKSAPKQTRTKGEAKKRAGKKGRQRPRDGDPPIIVGGGGSTLIWIKRTAFIAELTDVGGYLRDHPDAPSPDRPNLYRCFYCAVDIERIESDDGKANGAGHAPNATHPPNPADKFEAGKHKTTFK